MDNTTDMTTNMPNRRGIVALAPAAANGLAVTPPARKATAPPVGLLDLPPELRNMIYKCALTVEGGLISRSTKSHGRVIYEPPWCSYRKRQPLPLSRLRDTNQLKYVNRQLADETRGLKLVYNELTFETGDLDSFESLEAFVMNECSKKIMCQIGGISFLLQRYLYSGPELRLISVDQLGLLQKIHEAYPQLRITIRVHWAQKTFNLRWGLLGGSCVQYALRGTIPDAWDTEELSTIMVYCQEERKFLLEKDVKIPAYVLVKPAVPFDEDKYKKAILMGGLDGEKAKLWLAQCRKWYEEGF